MHLLKYYRWTKISNTIKIAGDKFENKSQPPINFEIFLESIELGTSTMPISFLISIESILYKDIEKLSDEVKKGY